MLGESVLNMAMLIAIRLRVDVMSVVAPEVKKKSFARIPLSNFLFI
jgi:hypothetical protein